MLTINNPDNTVWYILRNDSGVAGHGSCSPGETLTTPVKSIEVFETREAQQLRLVELGYVNVDADLDMTNLTLEQQRDVMKHRINLLREQKMVEPVSYMDHLFDADETAMQNITGMLAAIAAGLTLPDTFTWRSYDNQDVPFTSPALVGLAAAVMLKRTGLYQRSWYLKATVDVSDNPSSVVITTGW